MECLVIVRPEGPDGFSASAVGVPEVRAVAATEDEAVRTVSRSLTQWLTSARLVRIEVPVGSSGNAWLDTFGRSAGDPDFEEFLEEVRRARAAEMG